MGSVNVETLIRSEYADAVDARLASFDTYVEYQLREARRALPFLAKFFPLHNARVLDIGAGRGGKSIAYAQAGMQITAMDVDRSSLKVAADSARKHGAQIDFLVADGAVLPLPANHFDAILLDSVIEHTRDPRAIMVECWRVLKTNGIVFVVFPPYYGPLSGHIDDYVMIPWLHLLPKKYVERYLLTRPSQPGILTPRDAFEVYLTLNRLSIFHFRQFAQRAGFQFAYERARPFLTHPGMRLAAGLLATLRHPSVANLRGVLARARREFSFGTFVLFLLLSFISPFVFVPLLQEIAAGAYKAVLRKSEPSQ